MSFLSRILGERLSEKVSDKTDELLDRYEISDPNAREFVRDIVLAFELGKGSPDTAFRKVADLMRRGIRKGKYFKEEDTGYFGYFGPKKEKVYINDQNRKIFDAITACAQAGHAATGVERMPRSSDVSQSVGNVFDILNLRID